MECDDMSIDVILEEIEQTALKFALAEFQGNISAGNFSSIAAINENSMKSAIEWHSGKTKRLEIFYRDPANRQDWKRKQRTKIIMQDIENDGLELIRGQLYWVVPAIADREPIYAEFIGYEDLVAEFMNPEDKSDYFTAREVKVN